MRISKIGSVSGFLFAATLTGWCGSGMPGGLNSGGMPGGLNSGELPSASQAPNQIETHVVTPGASAVTPAVQAGQSALQFIPVVPCRIADTRNANGPFGGPELAANTTREFNIPQSSCNIPSTAIAYSINVTVVPGGFLNYLTLWPSGQTQPVVSTLNSDGRVKANAAIVPAGSSGGVNVFVTNPTQVILDIDGYFVAGGTAGGLAFFPVTPCRIADTRNASGPFGGPSLPAGGSRSFPVLSSPCNLPSNAQAYSLNVTAIPHSTLNYLTTWPTGLAQPNVSTLNASTGAVTANAAIVPAGTSGQVSVFVYDAADVILDVNGYFAPPATGGLSLFTTTPCRIVDTRSTIGDFFGTQVFGVSSSPCAPPATAGAYVLNATVVPQNPLIYLALWPDGASQPNVSTLNADDSAITSNLAIVPNLNGSVATFADGYTNVILDISSYFEQTLTVTTSSPLPSGTLGSSYVTTLTAAGGTEPYTWSVTSGTLPAGLTLSSTGIISGTPTVTGSFPFVAEVTDSASPAKTATATFTLSVAVGPLAVTTTSLPNGSVGTAYSAQLAATGGVSPYTWSVASGSSLPAGLTLSSAGVLSGTPGATGTTTTNFIVSDSTSNSAPKDLPITINSATGTIPDGQYTFLFAGTAPQGTPSAQNGIAMNGTFAIHSGTVTGGFFDENTNTNPAVTEQAISGGSLSVGANGIGQLVLTTASSSKTFALAVPASVSSGGSGPIQIIEYDDATGTGSRGSGVLKAAVANPTIGGITGNYAFLLSGTDIHQNQQALICSFQTNGAGTIPGGKADANQLGGEFASWSTLSGGYTLDAHGRGVLTIVLGGADFHYSFYEVSPTEWLAISLDDATLNSPLVSGSVLRQTGSPNFSTASLPAVSVFGISGVQQDNPGTTPDITLGLASSNGSGGVTYKFDEYAGSLSSGSFTVTYAVDPVTGRAATTGSTPEPVLYIIDSNRTFLLGVDRSASSGLLTAQTGSPFTTASFSGNYLGGSSPLVLTSVLNESGLIAADGAGNVNFTTNQSSSTGLVYQNDVVVGTYTVASDGRGVITSSDGFTRIFYLISPTAFAYLTSDDGGYLGGFQK